MRVLITGGGGFLGSHLVERVRGGGLEPFVSRRRDYELTNLAELTGHGASRAEERFGFRAGTPFRAGLERTRAWYRAHQLAEAATE